MEEAWELAALVMVSGILEDVFEIQNRGVVLALKLLENEVVSVGDIIALENGSVKIRGINDFRYRTPKENSPLGILVDGNKEDFLGSVGKILEIEKANDQN